MALERLDYYDVALPMRAAESPRRRFGVPLGGPIDRMAFTFCSDATEVWETFGLGLSHWRVKRDGWLSVTGGARKLEVNGTLTEVPVAVKPGDQVCVSPVLAGQVAYIALSDNPIQQVKTEGKREVRILPSIDDLDQTPLLATAFSLSLSSSRHGWRLNEAISGAKDLPRSEPCAPGVIQCTPNGQLIIIGPDGPTIGGYARIGAVTDEDLDLLARIGFNQPFNFTKCEF